MTVRPVPFRLIHTRFFRAYFWLDRGPRFKVWREHSNRRLCVRLGVGRWRFHIGIGRAEWL
jgi:hypothetical protein